MASTCERWRGQLGHGGGGTTTLRVYAAWVSEADQRASAGLLDRLPQRPQSSPGVIPSGERAARNPYEVVAAELRAQILDGRLPAGSLLPGNKELTRRFEVAAGTAHRSATLLNEWGLTDVRRGHRAVVLGVGIAAGAGQSASGASQACGIGSDPQIAAVEVPTAARNVVDLHVRHLGADFARFSAEADLSSGSDLRRLLVAAVRRRGGDPAQIDEYEMDVRRSSDSAAIMTFATSSV